MKNTKTDKIENELPGGKLSDASTCYAPSQMKFYAVIDGETIREGDCWLPEDINGMKQTCSPSHCHPVTISSAGVHYCKKLRDGSHLTDEKGKTYYYDWEHTEICDSGKLYLISA